MVSKWLVVWEDETRTDPSNGYEDYNEAEIQAKACTKDCPGEVYYIYERAYKVTAKVSKPKVEED